MAATDSSAALFDRTNACVPLPPCAPALKLTPVRDRLLSSYNQQTLHAQKLITSVSVHGRSGGGSQQQQHGHTDNLTRWTQRGDVTGQNESGLVVDAMDRQRTDEDLKVFKVRRLLSRDSCVLLVRGARQV